eukprot:TRINITY_DN17399_c0_g1_i5.p1 TRINITY_DN17399_c0_g1~~TRINITY_DN17399_c0_g1_i5.p1  ORF type:complete len:382 (+),score=19.06 TRINITY_DN17399_c0_g1_i5:36-1181(+)
MACCFAFFRRKAPVNTFLSADWPPPKERRSNSGSLVHLAPRSKSLTLPNAQHIIYQVDQRGDVNSTSGRGYFWSGLKLALSKHVLCTGRLRQDNSKELEIANSADKILATSGAGVASQTRKARTSTGFEVENLLPVIERERTWIPKALDVQSDDKDEKTGRSGNDDGSSPMSCSSTRSSCEHLRTGSSLSSPAHSCTCEATLFRRWINPNNSGVHDEIRIEFDVHDADAKEQAAIEETFRQCSEPAFLPVIPYPCKLTSYPGSPFIGHSNDSSTRDVCATDIHDKPSSKKTATEGDGIVLNVSRDEESCCKIEFDVRKTKEMPAPVLKYTHMRTRARSVLHSHSQESEARLEMETIEQSVPAPVTKLSHRRTRTAYVGQVR